MKSLTLGIDPGLSGACALLGPEGAVQIFDVPTTERIVNKKKKRRIDNYQLTSWIELHRPLIKFAMVEEVSAMPGQGVTSSFNFGFTTGAIHGIIAACGIEIRTVVPQVWKRYYRLLGQDKDASRGEASRRFPQFTHLWTRKKDDGRAEAALLALYGQLTEGVVQ